MPKKYTSYPKYRFPQAKKRYAEIADSLKLKASSPEEGVESLIQAITELKAKLEIPPSIREMGVKQEEFEAALRHMAETAFDDQSVGGNPCYPLVDDIIAIFREAYGTGDKPF